MVRSIQRAAETLFYAFQWALRSVIQYCVYQDVWCRKYGDTFDGEFVGVRGRLDLKIDQSHVSRSVCSKSSRFSAPSRRQDCWAVPPQTSPRRILPTTPLSFL